MKQGNSFEGRNIEIIFVDFDTLHLNFLTVAWSVSEYHHGRWDQVELNFVRYKIQIWR